MRNFAKIIIIPDSFKGGMSSSTVCEIAERAIKEQFHEVQVEKIPVADGGEGTVDAMLTAIGGKKIHAKVHGPFGDEINSFYGMLPNGSAIIEMAAAAGLPLAAGRLNPLRASTYGVGELMKHAIQHGCRHIILGMGGSATNDAGCGAAAALGVQFFNENGKTFIPVGETLSQIYHIDKSGCRLPVGVTAMCDIDNPLYGPNGAAFVFSPQKGANAQQVALLDAQLRAFAQVTLQEMGTDIAQIAGGGAAGGFGAGAVCFFSAVLKKGIEIVLDTVDFDTRLQSASLVITGEGRIDTQSLRGKVVIGVASRAKVYGVPVIAVVGDVGDDISEAYDMGINAVFSINRVAVPFDRAVLRSKQDLYSTLSDVMRFARVLIDK